MLAKVERDTEWAATAVVHEMTRQARHAAWNGWQLAAESAERRERVCAVGGVLPLVHAARI